MKRRSFLSLLAGSVCAVAVGQPAQARRRRRHFNRRFTRRSDRSGRRLNAKRTRTDYQPTSWSSGDMPVAKATPNRVAQATSKPRNSGINRNSPEFRRSPGEIDRDVVPKITSEGVRGMTKGQIQGKYGLANRDDGSTLIWNIGRTSDGIIAPQKFYVDFDGQGKAYNVGRQ